MRSRGEKEWLEKMVPTLSQIFLRMSNKHSDLDENPRTVYTPVVLIDMGSDQHLVFRYLLLR